MTEDNADYMAETVTGLVITSIMVYGVILNNELMYLPAMAALVLVLFARMFFRGL